MNTPSLQTKLPGVGTTIFTIMSQLAADHDAINLSQGFPDFEPPAELLDLLARHLQKGHNQYPPMAGVMHLREAIATKVSRLYNAVVDPVNEITITSGATEALFVAIQATITPGDEAIVLDPAYDAYDPAVTMAGGKTIHIPMQPPGYRPDWDRVRAAISDRTRLVIINSPHNPTGTILDSGDLDQLASILENTGIFVLSDEVYEHMVFDQAPHESLCAHAALKHRSFVVSSFGKTCHATGWKVAYCLAPAPMTEEFRKIHQFVTFTTHTPTQWALADFTNQYPGHYLQLPAFYQEKRDLFLDQMADSAFSLIPSAGTYFQLADYSAVSDLPDTEFARWLTTEVGVAAIPVSVFYESPPSARMVRFCFCKDNSTLVAATERLRQLSAGSGPQ